MLSDRNHHCYPWDETKDETEQEEKKTEISNYTSSINKCIEESKKKAERTKKRRQKIKQLNSYIVQLNQQLDTLLDQLEKTKTTDRISLPYHQKILKKQIPYTIGGGIGQSRLLMLLLGSSHIAEVQASSWEEKTLKKLYDKKIL